MKARVLMAAGVAAVLLLGGAAFAEEHISGAEYLRAVLGPKFGAGRRITPSLRKQENEYYQVGDQRQFWVYDLTTMPPEYKQITATCRAVGEHSYVFVHDEEWDSSITQDDVDAILDAFETATPADSSHGIYETDTGLFGDPSDIDNDPHIFLLFYQLGSFHGYVFDGYFSIEDLQDGPNSNRTELLHLDVDNASSDYNLGVIAHEFVHLIQANYDPAEVQWMSEALAEIGMVATGFITGDNYSALDSFAGDHASRPLTGWVSQGGKEMIDYGAVMLWGVYLWEQFGTEFLRGFMADTAKGKTALVAALEAHGDGRTLHEVFGDFAAACFLGENGSGAFGYAHLEVPAFTLDERVQTMPATVQLELDRDTLYYLSIEAQPDCEAVNALRAELTGTNTEALAVRLISRGTETSVAAFDLSDPVVRLPECGSASYVLALFNDGSAKVSGELNLSFEYVEEPEIADGDNDVEPEVEASSEAEAELTEPAAETEPEPTETASQPQMHTSSEDEGCTASGSALFGALAVLLFGLRKRK